MGLPWIPTLLQDKQAGRILPIELLFSWDDPHPQTVRAVFSFDTKGVPSMTLISLTDCCRLLAIDSKTLHRWMSLSHLSAQSHPLDARLKCLSSAQIEQLASTHRRVLTPVELPLSPATADRRLHPASDVLPDVSAPLTDLTKQMISLQEQVAMLQHQLTLLMQQLQKEQKWRISQTSMLKEKSLESSLDKSPDKSLESSLDKSLEKASARTVAKPASIERRKRSHVLPLVEYGTQGQYVVICPQQGLLDFSPDSAEWFAWLSTLSSFRFVGLHGHLTVHRDARCNPRWSWRATRSIRSRSHSLHLVRTESLTLAVLEQAAASLQSLLN
jgi:hypothetical protein